MQRTQDPTKEANKFGPGLHGFTEGSPGVVVPTRFRASDANMLQEAVCRPCEAAGLTLDPDNYDQLTEAIRLLATEMSDERAAYHAARIGVANAEAFSVGATVGDIVCGVRCGDNGSLVLAGTGGQILEGASHATSWTERTAAGGFTDTFFGAATSSRSGVAGSVVLVGDGGTIQTAPDTALDTWTARTAAGGFTGFFSGVAYSPALGLFCAVGESGTIQSASGAALGTWTARTAAGAYAGDFHAVAWAADLGVFVAVGTGGQIQTSPDGITWTARTSGVATDLLHVATDGTDLLVYAGASLLLSSDGITWETLGSPPSIGSVGDVVHHNTVWYMVGNSNRVAISPDRRTWRRLLVGGHELPNFAYGAAVPVGADVDSIAPDRLAIAGSEDWVMRTLGF